MVSAPPCHGGGRGFKSRPGRKGFGVVGFRAAGVEALFGLVAQLVGQLIRNEQIVGSMPTKGSGWCVLLRLMLDIRVSGDA